MTCRIGIDVGGTHTDAVLLQNDQVLASTKCLTTADVSSGVLDALETVLADFSGSEKDIQGVMLGTTQFTNAVIERRELAEVAAVRVGLPSGDGLPPKTGWPSDISRCLGDHSLMLKGGYLYDGWPMAELKDADIDRVVEYVKANKLEAVAVTSAFSPMNPEPELLIEQRLKAISPHIHITLSHRIGRLGLLERENAALLNCSLLQFADRVVNAFQKAIRVRGLDCPFFISQNDGTLMDGEFAKRLPALTFASGPTNSLRGASKLTGAKEAIVVDIGGTTSDIGVLHQGFPRESNAVIEVGGVRTNFRMPDILALGLGGGSEVSDSGDTVGPVSVGHQLVSQGRVFGGEVLTATDIAVAAGKATVGDPDLVAQLDSDLVTNAITTIQTTLDRGIEKMKPGSEPLPVILVGGGAVLVTEPLSAASEMLVPKNSGVANAIGAAIAQIGGEAERLIAYDQTPREEAKSLLFKEATELAVSAGADPTTIRLADIEETTMSYMANNTTRLRVKVVGDIAFAGDTP